MNKNLKTKILKLRQQGKTYKEICHILKCSLGNVCYHCGQGQKDKWKNREYKRLKLHPYLFKLKVFLSRYSNPTIVLLKKKPIRRIIFIKLKIFFTNHKTRMREKHNITVNDIINKLGETPKCYLTGQNIDISKPSTYAFDHIIPVSRGGHNTLDNLGVCTKQVNRSKTDMTLEEYIALCKKVLEYHGYTITKSTQ